MKHSIFITAFIVGLILIGMNIYGFFIPLKNPAIYQETNTGFDNDTTLTPSETYSLLESIDKADSRKMATSANDIFNRSIAHYWEDEGLYKYNMTIPPYENWILASLQFILPSVYKRYEYCDYKKAVERGIGLCSQHAIAIVDFLNENNIEAHMLGLDGHVVALGNVDNSWWVLDPDFGVVIPHSIQEIENDPEIVRSYYSGKPYKNGSLTLDDIVNIYGKEGNIIYPLQFSGIGNVGYIDCGWKKVLIRKFSYILKWVIPFLLITPLLYRYAQKNP